MKPFFLISCIRHIAKTLGEAFCTFIFLHFPHSGLSVLNRLHFYFWWHDSENRGLPTWTLSHKSSLQLLSYLAASLTYCILVFFTTRYQYLALFYTRCAFFTLKWVPIPIIVIWTIALNITNWRAIFHYRFLLISTGCSTATTWRIFIFFGIVCAWTARWALCVISWRLAFFAHKVACRTKIAAKSRNWWTKLSSRTTQSTHYATCRKTLKKNAKKYIVSVNAKWGTPILLSFRSSEQLKGYNHHRIFIRKSRVTCENIKSPIVLLCPSRG